MYLFFDTETTGLPKNWKAPVTDLNNWPRLVQLAYLLYDTSDQEMVMKEVKTSPWESVSQLILLGLMIAAGFVQPTFLVNLIEMAVK